MRILLSSSKPGITEISKIINVLYSLNVLYLPMYHLKHYPPKESMLFQTCSDQYGIEATSALFQDSVRIFLADNSAFLFILLL